MSVANFVKIGPLVLEIFNIFVIFTGTFGVLEFWSFGLLDLALYLWFYMT